MVQRRNTNSHNKHPLIMFLNMQSICRLLQLSAEVFNNGGNTQTTAAAGGEQTLLTAAPLQLAHGNHSNSCTGGAVGVTEGNGAAVGIPLALIDGAAGSFLNAPDNAQILGSKGFVALPYIDVVHS